MAKRSSPSRKSPMSVSLTPSKAKQMLKDNSAQGKPLTAKQKGLFGVIASGQTPTRTKEPS